MYKRALISVSDKRGLEGFLKPLVKQGLSLVSTGGTGEFLKSKGFKVVDVKDITGFPEVLSGRVKTLHPHIHIALLARQWVLNDKEILKQYGLEPFDLVVGNLYPFEQQEEHLNGKELVEWIDVGGPSFLRASAKNYFSITTVCDPEDYSKIQNGADLKQRQQLAVKVFETLSHYDSCIAKRLKEQSEGNVSHTRLNKQIGKDVNHPKKQSEENIKQDFFLEGKFFKKLRYGENPHQEASWHSGMATGLHEAEQLQGKTLSYNNILDFYSALLVVRDFDAPCAVAVKHNNPCGVAIANQISSAVERALKADPLSVFGALLAFNRPVDKLAAEQLNDVFLEGLIAPDFSPEALKILSKKKNLRIIKWPEMLSFELSLNSVRETIGGFLIQTRDQVAKNWSQDWKIVGSSPSEDVKKDLIFAWKVCAHLKSNAIAIVQKGQSLGLGMGQVSRVDAVQLALDRVKRLHPLKKKDMILASDAFFPFADSIELAARGGISWIIQPGGSIRDDQILEKTLKLGLNMILTGQRHFKH